MNNLTDSSLSAHGVLTESSLIDHIGKGREGKGSGREVGRLSSIGSSRRHSAARHLTPQPFPSMDEKQIGGWGL